ncbi:MAG: hypothetical protein AAFW46_16940 [Pseudomonadota bacterium]
MKQNITAAVVAAPLSLSVMPDNAHAQTAEEAACYEKVQGNVAWNKQGNTRWFDDNVRDLCAGVEVADFVISCFETYIENNRNWQEAVPACKESQKPVEFSLPRRPDPETNPDRKLQTIYYITCYSGATRSGVDLTVINQSQAGQNLVDVENGRDCEIMTEVNLTAY